MARSSPLFLLLVLSAALPLAAAPVRFERYFDRSEGAFFVLVPRGWKTSGGMRRLNPLAAQGGVGNAIEATIDFAVSRDAAGAAAIRWLPKVNYAQPSPSNAMLGGNWNGMPIVAMPSAADFLARMLFPYLHPRAAGVRVVERKQRPDIVAAVEKLPVGQTMRSQGAYYVADAATLTVSYEEEGRRYREMLFVALEGYAMMGAGLWSNPFTIVARAPEAEFEAYGPLARAVVNSFSINPLWLRGELQGQADRSRIAQETLKDLSRVDAEIAKGRSETMASIQAEQYLTLTSQELYRNPKTGREELGSSEWKYRWVGPGNEVIYSDDPSWDPNRDPSLKVSGFERSPAAKR